MPKKPMTISTKPGDFFVISGLSFGAAGIALAAEFDKAKFVLTTRTTPRLDTKHMGAAAKTELCFQVNPTVAQGTQAEIEIVATRPADNKEFARKKYVVHVL